VIVKNPTYSTKKGEVSMANKPVEVDKKELRKAQNTWQAFIKASKVVSVLTGLLLITLFIIFLQ